MSNSWDKYFNYYSDWDHSRCFNVRLDLKYENDIKTLGYIEFFDAEDNYLIDKSVSNQISPRSRSYKKTKNEILLSYEVPYDWSIDTDWEDKALTLLGLCDEWIIDSSVEDK